MKNRPKPLPALPLPPPSRPLPFPPFGLFLSPSALLFPSPSPPPFSTLFFLLPPLPPSLSLPPHLIAPSLSAREPLALLLRFFPSRAALVAAVHTQSQSYIKLLRAP
jgi:hypothetical protein